MLLVSLDAVWKMSDSAAAGRDRRSTPQPRARVASATTDQADFENVTPAAKAQTSSVARRHGGGGGGSFRNHGG